MIKKSIESFLDKLEVLLFSIACVGFSICLMIKIYDGGRKVMVNELCQKEMYNFCQIKEQTFVLKEVEGERR